MNFEMKTMTDKEITEAIEDVQATIAVEGLKMNRRNIVYGRKYLKGEMTNQEAIDKITKHIKKRILNK